MSAMDAATVAARIEDIESDLWAGLDPRRIAADQGVRLGSLTQWLVGHGRRDLAHRLDKNVSPERPAWMADLLAMEGQQL